MHIHIKMPLSSFYDHEPAILSDSFCMQKANAHGSPYPQKVSGLDKKTLPVPMTITHKSVVPAD